MTLIGPGPCRLEISPGSFRGIGPGLSRPKILSDFGEKNFVFILLVLIENSQEIKTFESI
jgi:hypothetical protein